jgi:hypothetical protein
LTEATCPNRVIMVLSSASPSLCGTFAMKIFYVNIYIKNLM